MKVKGIKKAVIKINSCNDPYYRIYLSNDKKSIYCITGYLNSYQMTDDICFMQGHTNNSIFNCINPTMQDIKNELLILFEKLNL